MNTDVFQDRLPPQNQDAERALLGGMLRENTVIGDVLQIIKDDNLYSDAHQKIFRAIALLYDQARPIDLVTLGEQLHQQKHIEDIGGYDYLVEIWEATPSSANAQHHAQIVRDKAIIRNLIHTGNEILRDSYNQNAPADELLEGAERKILDIADWGVTGQTVDMEAALREAMARIDARHQGGVSSETAIPTGYVDIDERTGGLQNSELIVLAARPSMGKTALGLNITRHVAVEEGQPVFFVSLEQSRVELAERLLCAQAQVDSHKLRKGTIGHDSQDMQSLLHAGGILKEHAKIFIDDSPGQTMLRIAANARRLKLRHDIRLVVVDYLQLVEPDNRRESRQEQVSAISRRLKFLAKELKIPVLACAQLNRGPEDRTENRPRLSDLRESGAIEQDADTVMLLNRPEFYDPNNDPGVAEVIIAKQRNGPTGTVKLAFVKQHMRFENFISDGPFQAGD